MLHVVVVEFIDDPGSKGTDGAHIHEAGLGDFLIGVTVIAALEYLKLTGGQLCEQIDGIDQGQILLLDLVAFLIPAQPRSCP